jgi:hypothetical protein
VAGEHSREIVEGEIVICGRVFAIWEAHATRQKGVVEGEAAEDGERPQGGESKVKENKEGQGLECNPRQERPR